MGVLVQLASHPGEVLSKSRLIDAVWGEAFVTEEVVSHAIWELRKAFADNARAPKFIQTIPKKGYRLVARVRPVAPQSAEDEPGVRRYEILGPLDEDAEGLVFRARDTHLDREVALELLGEETGEVGAKAEKAAPTMSSAPSEAVRSRRSRALPLVVLLAGLAVGAVFWQLLSASAPPVVEDPRVERLLEQGQAYEQRGDTREYLGNAEDLYAKALEISPGDPQIQAQLALLLTRLQRAYPSPERLEQIRNLVDHALSSQDDLPLAWLARAKLLLLDGDAVGAESAARRAADHASEDDRVLSVLGEALIDQGKIEEGLRAIRDAVEVGDGHIRARLVLGLELTNLGRMNEAAAELEEVLTYAPDSPNALNNLGSIYLRTGRDLDAIPLFRRVLELHRDERAASNLGFAYYNLDRMDEAIEAFREAHRLEPGHPSPARNLGDTYEKLGDLERARRWFEIALENYDGVLEAGGPRSRNLARRAVCAAKLGRFDEAIPDVSEAVELAPGNSFRLFNAAQVFALAGDLESTFEYLGQALAAGFSREEIDRELCFSHLRELPRFQRLLAAE